MDRQQRDRAEPVLDRGEDARECVGTVDHHEKAAGVEQGERGPEPGCEGGARLGWGEDRARARAPSGETPTVPGSKKGGLVTTQSAFSSPSPASRRSTGLKRVEPEDADARLKSVPRGVDLGEAGQIGIDLDQIGERPLRPLRQRQPQPDRADSRADVGDPAGRRTRRRNEQGGVRADPMSAFRLDKGEPAAEPAIEASPSAIGSLSSPGGGSGIAQFPARPASAMSRRARPSSRLSTMIRRGRKPSDPSTAAICWSATKKATRSAVRIDSMTLIRTRSLVRMISTKAGPRLADLPRRFAVFMVEARRLARESASWESLIPLEEKSADRLIEPLTALVADDMDRVNQTILSRTGSEVTMIPEVANHLISSGGKRLRPILTLATAGLCGYSGDGRIKLAAAVEFMHTATLLHDDVVDESDMRRGREAARVLWGNEASVLVGDFLLGQAFRMMVEVGSLPCLDVLSSAAVVIAEGEVMQLSAAKDTETTEDAYLAVIRAKTAALFAAACEVGPTLAGRAKAEIAACRGYGANLGIAFQLIDDALDYGGSSAKLGKNVGDDFREGKITLPWCCRSGAGRRMSATSGAGRSRRAKSSMAISRLRLRR